MKKTYSSLGKVTIILAGAIIFSTTVLPEILPKQDLKVKLLENNVKTIETSTLR